MQINSSKIKFIVGSESAFEKMLKAPTLPMFSQCVIDFLSELSRRILNDKRSKLYTDVMSYAYWIRKASLERVKEKHRDRKYRIGRGIAFHIAPSNVPVNFAVSMTSSLLAGNVTLIRVSNKEFEQVNIITDVINNLLNTEFEDLKPYILIVRYEHDDEITRELSSVCDVRVVWGGNKTIEEIRKAPIPTRAIEMAFADRHSVAIINADEYLKMDYKDIAKSFYTDTYYTDQNACSSPRLVVWIGNDIENARKLFWDKLKEKVIKEYDMKPIQAIDKYTSLCMLGMAENNQKLVSSDNYIVRIEVDNLNENLMTYKNGGGYFFEYVANSLEEILPVLNKQCQTISVLGVDKTEVKDIVFKNGVRGVDRIVSLGQTMGLEFIWDGYKMIENMSRFVYVGEYE